MTRDQYDKWLEELPAGTCTFCQWPKYQSIIREFKYWIWADNIAPYWYFHTMFIPKRHFERESDMTIHEMSELVQVKDFAFDAVMNANLVFPRGDKKVEKFVYFHRFRVNRFDPISGTTRPSHYHDHFTPDIDHRWDSTLDADAYKFNISEYLKGVKIKNERR